MLNRTKALALSSWSGDWSRCCSHTVTHSSSLSSLTLWLSVCLSGDGGRERQCGRGGLQTRHGHQAFPGIQKVRASANTDRDMFCTTVTSTGLTSLQQEAEGEHQRPHEDRAETGAGDDSQEH